MNQHVINWLQAYHDSELQGLRLSQVEAHLKECADCRAALERLQKLSAWLQESPAPEGLILSERFVAQVGMFLTRRPVESTWQKTLKVAWQFAPLGLLGAGAFVQTVIILSWGVLQAIQLGLGGEMMSKLFPLPQPGVLTFERFGFFTAGVGDLSWISLELLQSGGPLGWSTMFSLALWMLIALLSCSWLASWWIYNQNKESPGQERYV